MSIYNLQDEFQRQQFLVRAKHLADKGCAVELKERRPQRSDRQNRFCHVCIGYFACQVGETLDYCKRAYFKCEANRPLFEVKAYDKVLKRETARLRSTASLSVEEMTLAIDRFRSWASETAGIYIPDPSDYSAMVEMEREIEKNKNFI